MLETCRFHDRPVEFIRIERVDLDLIREITIRVLCHHGEPAITRERKHFSKIHESDCKPSTCLACSYLNSNWREEVSAALCSAVDRQNE